MTNNKLSAPRDPRPGLDTFLPALLCFGPLFLLVGLEGGPELSGHVLAAAGAVLLSTGLGGLFAKQLRLERRLDEMERLKVRASP